MTNIVTAIADFGWVVTLLGWPFALFHYVWPNAWWGHKLVVFWIAYLFFSAFSKSVCQGGLADIFEFPWYAPLAVFLYPLLIVNYLTPNGSAFIYGLAFILALVLGYRWANHVTS